MRMKLNKSKSEHYKIFFNLTVTAAIRRSHMKFRYNNQ